VISPLFFYRFFLVDSPLGYLLALSPLPDEFPDEIQGNWWTACKINSVKGEVTK